MNATLVPQMTDGRPTPHSVPFVLDAAVSYGYDSFGIAWGNGEHGERWEARIAAANGSLPPEISDELTQTLTDLRGADGGNDLRVLGEGPYAVVVLLGGVVLSEVEAHARSHALDALAGMCRRIAEAWSSSLIDAA